MSRTRILFPAVLTAVLTGALVSTPAFADGVGKIKAVLSSLLGGANLDGSGATDGQVLKYTAATNTWGPGTSSVTYPLTAPDGTSGAPSYRFANEATLGFYRDTSGVIGIAGGELRSASGRTFTAGSTGSGDAAQLVCGASGAAFVNVTASTNGIEMNIGGDRYEIPGLSKALSTTSSTLTTFATIPLTTTLTGGHGTVFYSVKATSASDIDVATGHFDFAAVNKAGTLTVTAGTITDVKASTSGSITSGVTVTASGTTIHLNVTPVFTTIVPTAVVLDWQIEWDGNPVTITPQ